MFIEQYELIRFFPSLINAESNAILIDWAGQAIERHCDRILEQRSTIDIHYQSRGPKVILSDYPVSGLVARIDGVVVDQTRYILDPESGILTWIDRPDFTTIRFEYLAGYNPLPSNLKLAAISAVGEIHQRLSSANARSEKSISGSQGRIKKMRVEDYEEEYFEAKEDGATVSVALAIGVMALALIEPYKKKGRRV